MTMLVVILIIVFQIEYLANEKGTTVFETVKQDYFDLDTEFKTEDGFNIAIAVHDPNSSDVGIDPTYV